MESLCEGILSLLEVVMNGDSKDVAMETETGRGNNYQKKHKKKKNRATQTREPVSAPL